MLLGFIVRLLLIDCFSQPQPVYGSNDMNSATTDSTALFHSESAECHDFYSHACSILDNSTRLPSFVKASKTLSDEIYSEIQSILPTAVDRCLNVGENELKSFKSLISPLFDISYSKTALLTLIKIYQTIGGSMQIQSNAFFTIFSSPNLVS